MKNKHYIATLSASFLACAMAHAGEALAIAPAASAPTISSLGTYLGVSGVYNQFTLGNLGGGGGSIDEDTTGFKVLGGLALSHGFSIDGSFEKTYGSADLGGTDTDFNFTDTRLLINYTHELNQGFSLIGGLGYGYLGFDVQGFTVSSEGLLAEVGVKYQSGQFFGGLTYTHLFSLHSSAFALGGPGNFSGEDVGAIEASLGYQINENIAATLSVETQVVGDSILEKDLGIAIGLLYSF
jgi:hypothetical protein